MIFEEYEGYNKPKVTKINQHVSIAVYKGKGKETIVNIANNKSEELQRVILLATTLKKISNKIRLT